MAYTDHNNFSDEIENADFYNDIIELEMNNLLFESDYALVRAESELMATSEDPLPNIEEDIENSPTLSMEVSEDMLKELTEELHLSSIHYSSDSTKTTESKNNKDISITEKNLLHNYSNALNNYNKNYAPYITEHNQPDDLEKTLTNCSIIEHCKEMNVNDQCNIKSDSDCLAIDYTGSTLEITVTNDINENKNDDNIITPTKLKCHAHFVGCSQDFQDNLIQNDFKVIVATTDTEAISNDDNVNNLPANIEVKNVSINDTKIPIIINDLNAKPNLLKRPAAEEYLENPTKKFKTQSISNNLIIESGEDHNASESHEFTQVIFDPDETADHNDPKWAEIKELKTNEDYFQSVRSQWRSVALRNPHKNFTMRCYVTEKQVKIKKEANEQSEARGVSCVQFLDDRINVIYEELKCLRGKLNRLPRTKARRQRIKITNDIEHMQNQIRELAKNKEEIKQINMFYQEENEGWNANFLTKSQLSELQEQDKLLEFQMNFYK